jgi:pyruvate/2-oxoglutarate dehydrogenase complex dihydrolipoamide dehydrogenase (E3) component
MRRFDAIIIGAGQAGPALAGRLTAAGQTVAIVERNLFGGTCVNTGCTPTKTMVASAAVAHAARRAGDYGVGISGKITVDLAKVKARADAVVGASRSHLESWIRAMEGCTVIEGQARFETATRLRVGDELIEAPQIFVNVGGRPVVPDMPGIGDIHALTSTSLLALETLPKHLVVVGGSYVGLEFAQMFRRFGAQVTVVEKGPRLVGREDEDVSTAIEEILQAEGIALRLNAECIHFAGDADAPRVGVDCTSGDREVVGSHVLIAVGRRPNTDDLGLEAAGVATDKRGYITVDDQLRTNVAGIWALGDCNGRGAFTHTAYNDFEIVAANLLDNDPRRLSDRLPVYALYIDPPLGRVGLTEAEAIAAGKTIRIGKRPMTRVSRAIEKGETNGFMKVVVDADTDRIIGAAILGVGGDEAIHGIIDTMYADEPYTTLQRSVAIHPTVSELIPTMLGELGAKVAPV